METKKTDSGLQVKKWQWPAVFLLAFLVIWAMLPLFFAPHTPNFFMALIIGTCAVGVYLVLHPSVLPKTYRRLWATKAGKALLVAVHTLLLGGVILLILFTMWALRAAGRAPQAGDPLLVCGAHVTEEGPAPVLTERLNAAIVYLKANPEALCVVTGGQGGNESRPEAEVMGEYLIQNGIEADRILLETESVNTEENVRNGLALLREKGYSGNRLALCTDRLHQYRAQRNAAKLGMETSAVAAKTPFFQLLNHWIREMMAIGKAVVAD